MRTTAGRWSDIGRPCRLYFPFWTFAAVVCLMTLTTFSYCYGKRVIDPRGLTTFKLNTSTLNIQDKTNPSYTKGFPSTSNSSVPDEETSSLTHNNRFLDMEKAMRNFLLDNGNIITNIKMTTRRHVDDEEDVVDEFCGDGIVGENEDCDCGGVINCSMSAAAKCCDALTCRLRSGAQCAADGPCCNRDCQLKRSGQVCRPIRNSCDLPEVCSGASSHCPPDAFRRNGQQCMAQQGYCFNRQCITHDQQCFSMWGFHSASGKDECFNQFNSRGSFNGNCGLMADGSTYRPCKKEDSMCGVLQCKGGGYTPSASTQKYFATTILTNVSGTLVQCKTFTPEVVTSHSVQVTLVQDGTKCDHQKICLRNKCMPFKHLLPETDCPSFSPTTVCSGHGLCTDLNTCFCDIGYHHQDCSYFNNRSLQLVERSPVQDMLLFRRGVALLDSTKRRTNYNEIVNNEALQTVVVIMSVVLLGATLGIMSLTCCRGHCKTQQRPNLPLMEMNQFTEQPGRKAEIDDTDWSLTSSV